ncbi:MAG: AAA family ATPase [Candidatus Symbiothrix sp.]|jgi:predicted ATPase|nr:AAA family ATPase [Candidatus Symbiothrix sp.]
MNTNLIKRIEIKGLFHQYDLKWDLNPDVNILVGTNGIGKSTILRTINALLSKKYSYIRDWKMDVEIHLTDNSLLSYDNLKPQKNISIQPNYEYITTFDVPLRDKTKITQSETPLDKELQQILYTTGKENQNSFINYRLKATHSPKLASTINQRIDNFFDSINVFFAETKKTIDIDHNFNKIIFHQNKSVIALEQLSSGEKQILLILFTVFLMEKKQYILLMDEPEISLHIGWQQRLIDVIQQMNPNCQLIIATHSPSIFGKGWGSKLFFVKDLIQNYERR